MKPDTLSLLFIGGPADGQVKTVPSNMTRIEVPYMTPLRADFTNPDLPDIHTAIYERLTLGDTRFFFHEPDGPDEALHKLLRSYAPRLSLAAKQQESLG